MERKGDRYTAIRATIHQPIAIAIMKKRGDVSRVIGISVRLTIGRYPSVANARATFHRAHNHNQQLRRRASKSLCVALLDLHFIII